MSRSGPTGSPFTALPAKVDLGDMDRQIIKWWQANNVFARSLERTADGPPWVFYEGPPTANGMPGTHHIEARVFKDVFPRYRTMKGYSRPAPGRLGLPRPACRARRREGTRVHRQA